MSTIHWMNKLNKEQIENFFRLQGLEFDSCEMHPILDDRMMIELVKTNGSKQHYEIFHDGISDLNIGSNIQITSEDWKVFMRDIFGDEYIYSLGCKDDENSFIEKLTQEDILKIIGFEYPSSIESVIEVKALLKGTRRFKFISNKRSYEFIITPYLYHSNTGFAPKSLQGRFIKLMTKKFGEEFASIYRAFEKKECEADIQEYANKRRNILSAIDGYMNKIKEKRENNI